MNVLMCGVWGAGVCVCVCVWVGRVGGRRRWAFASVGMLPGSGVGVLAISAGMSIGAARHAG